MTTTLTDAWARVRAALDAHAPVTAGTVRAAAATDDIAEAQSVMGQAFPEAVREQLLLFDGAEPNPATGVLLPPLYIPVGLQRMRMLWKHRCASSAIWAGGEVDAAAVAGEPCRGFHPLLLPIGDDTTGDLLVVDNRPGELRGSVLTWSRDDGLFGAPAWRSVTEMWSDVASALETGSTQGTADDDPLLTRNGCAAVFTAEGTLEWEF